MEYDKIQNAILANSTLLNSVTMKTQHSNSMNRITENLKYSFHWHQCEWAKINEAFKLLLHAKFDKITHIFSLGLYRF